MDKTAHAIVLAAGRGSRFGGRKMLAEWRGEPLVLAAVRAALAGPVARVTVVTGADGDEVEAALAPMASPRLAVVGNPDWRSGIASSLRAGLAALPEDAACAVIFLGDMPLVPIDAAARLLAALATGAPAALSEVDGVPAHPVAFSRALFGAVRQLQGDRGARALLAALPGVARIAADDPGCLFDVDRPSDAVPPPPLAHVRTGG